MSRRVLLRSLVALVMAVAGLAAVPGAAPAAVVPLAGADSAAVMRVPCSGPGGGAEGLAAAIETANGAVHPTQIRLVPACVYLVTTVGDVPDGGGLPAVTAKVTVTTPVGHPATIARPSWAPPFSLINVNAGGALKLVNIIVTGALSVDGYVGGGLSIARGGSATLIRSRVTRNAVRYTTGFLASGAGIYSNGTVTLIDSRVDSNVASNTAPDALAAGGGITSEEFGPESVAKLVLRGSIVENNVATAVNGTEPGATGGGIATLGNATTILDGSVIVKNRVVARGPASAALGAGLFDNLSYLTGFAHTMLTITRTRVHGNRGVAENGFAAGGGLYSATGDQSRVGPGAAVVGNRVTAPGGSADGGGLFEEAPGLITVSRAALVRDNLPSNCDASLACG